MGLVLFDVIGHIYSQSGSEMFGAGESVRNDNLVRLHG